MRTIVSGLAYLATFVYAANGTGLVALAAQKWLDKLTGVDLIDEQAAAGRRRERRGTRRRSREVSGVFERDHAKNEKGCVWISVATAFGHFFFGTEPSGGFGNLTCVHMFFSF